MKTMMSFLLVIGFTLLTSNASAHKHENEVSSENQSKQSTEKRSRRKKVQMCHECGKPETQCECEGEEHGIKDEENHSHDEE